MPEPFTIAMTAARIAKGVIDAGIAIYRAIMRFKNASSTVRALSSDILALVNVLHSATMIWESSAFPNSQIGGIKSALENCAQALNDLTQQIPDYVNNQGNPNAEAEVSKKNRATWALWKEKGAKQWRTTLLEAKATLSLALQNSHHLETRNGFHNMLQSIELSRQEVHQGLSAQTEQSTQYHNRLQDRFDESQERNASGFQDLKTQADHHYMMANDPDYGEVGAIKEGDDGGEDLRYIRGELDKYDAFKRFHNMKLNHPEQLSNTPALRDNCDAVSSDNRLLHVPSMQGPWTIRIQPRVEARTQIDGSLLGYDPKSRFSWVSNQLVFDLGYSEKVRRVSQPEQYLLMYNGQSYETTGRVRITWRFLNNPNEDEDEEARFYVFDLLKPYGADMIVGKDWR